MDEYRTHKLMADGQAKELDADANQNLPYRKRAAAHARRRAGILSRHQHSRCQDRARGHKSAYEHQFYELCILGEKLFVLPSQQPGKGFHSAEEHTADGTNILTIGEFRGQFEPLDQQKRFLNLPEQFLSILGTVSPRDLQDGVEAPAIVAYDPALSAKIVSGKTLL